MKRYKILYVQKGGKFRVLVIAISIEKAIYEFRRKSTFQLVEILEVTYIEHLPLSDEQKLEIVKRLESIKTFLSGLSDGLIKIINKT